MSKGALPLPVFLVVGSEMPASPRSCRAPGALRLLHGPPPFLPILVLWLLFSTLTQRSQSDPKHRLVAVESETSLERKPTSCHSPAPVFLPILVLPLLVSMLTQGVQGPKTIPSTVESWLDRGQVGASRAVVAKWVGAPPASACARSNGEGQAEAAQQDDPEVSRRDGGFGRSREHRQHTHRVWPSLRQQQRPRCGIKVGKMHLSPALVAIRCLPRNVSPNAQPPHSSASLGFQNPIRGDTTGAATACPFPGPRSTRNNFCPGVRAPGV